MELFQLVNNWTCSALFRLWKFLRNMSEIVRDYKPFMCRLDIKELVQSKYPHTKIDLVKTEVVTKAWNSYHQRNSGALTNRFFKWIFRYWNSFAYLLPKQIWLTIESNCLYKKTKCESKSNHEKMFSVLFLGLAIQCNFTYNNWKPENFHTFTKLSRMILQKNTPLQ